MYKELSKANVKLQKSRIAQKVWTKSDIGAFGKMLNSYRFASLERRAQIMELWSELGYDYDITEEQSQFGINWLKALLFTKRGKRSTNKKIADFIERDFQVVENFSYFKFVGFHETCGYGGCSYYSPIYRAVSKDGRYFEYTMSGGHWGVPEIIDRGSDLSRYNLKQRNLK